jgi:two-component sensor histidine kinase
MALIHEKLYQSSDVAKIDFGDYIRALTSGLHSTFAMRTTPVQIYVEIEATQLSLDAALPCGLIINELVTNCFKYAFTPGSSGEIRITLEPIEEQRLRLRVADNGAGFPKGLDFRNTESLGMQIVTILTEQIEGTIEILPGPGTTFELIFPAENAVPV